MVRVDSYSRMIGWLKVVLPLLALALLSTLFLVARTVDPAQNLPFADVDVDELAREQRIGNPDYATVTSSGAAISVSARAARPDPSGANRVLGDDIAARIALPDGPVLDIGAATVVLDNETEIGRLEGDVLLESDNGYTMQAQALEVGLGTTRVASDGEVTVTGPIGRIEAGGFTLTGDGGTDRPYMLVFNNGVRLVYTGQERGLP